MGRLRGRIPQKDMAAGQWAVFLCAFFWSTSGLFIKLVGWHPVLIAGSRSLVAALCIAAAGPAARIVLKRRGAGRFRAKSRPAPLVAGGLAYAATMILFVTANKLTTSANAILLQYSAPVWAALLGFFIGEKPRWEHWGALVPVTAGLFIFFRGSLGGGSLAGDVLALLSGLTFGANSVFMRMQKEGNPSASMLLAHVITTLFCIPFAFLYPPEWTPAAAAAVIFMGTVQTGLASLLFSFGIRRIPAVNAMLVAMLEPVLNPLWVFAVTGETPGSAALPGGILIVGAVLASQAISASRETRRVKRTDEPPRGRCPRVACGE
jgi:drug/metabolite transporter (DMT)-like permease